MDWMLGRRMGQWFWGAGIGVGHVLPLVLLATGFAPAGVAAAVPRWRECWSSNGCGFGTQQVPLS